MPCCLFNFTPLLNAYCRYVSDQCLAVTVILTSFVHHAGAVWRFWVAPGLMWLCFFGRPSHRQTESQPAFFLSGCSACCCSCLSVCCCYRWSSTSAGNSDRVGMLLTFHVQTISRPLTMLYLLHCCVAKWILQRGAFFQSHVYYKYINSSPYCKTFYIKVHSKRGVAFYSMLRSLYFHNTFFNAKKVILSQCSQQSTINAKMYF